MARSQLPSAKYARHNRLCDTASLGAALILLLKVEIASSTRPAASKSVGESAAAAIAGNTNAASRNTLVGHFMIYCTTFTGMPSRKDLFTAVVLSAIKDLSLIPEFTSTLVRFEAATETLRLWSLLFTTSYTQGLESSIRKASRGLVITLSYCAITIVTLTLVFGQSRQSWLSSWLTTS